MNNDLIILGSDHNGIELKELLHNELKSKGYQCIDVGPWTHNQAVDYVDYANQLATIVASAPARRGILVCGTGVGMSIAANKVAGIRAVLAHNMLTARKSREHNDANVICLGSWVTSDVDSIHIVNAWLDESFAQGRHVKRIEKMSPRNNALICSNGSYDVLHRGHIELLKFAKSLGNRLVVLIDSDELVRKNKGPSRPINAAIDRKRVLESVSYVDEVIIFNDGELKEVRDSLGAGILVRGCEWTADEIRRRDDVPDDMIIKLFPIVDGYSTTKTIEKVMSTNVR